jgi:hypothetical protein
MSTAEDRKLAAAFNAYNRRDYKGYQALVAADELAPESLGKLLTHVCAYPPSSLNRDASRLMVLFESLVFGQKVADTVARHAGLKQANANVEASIGVDAIVATGRALPPAAVQKALEKAEGRGCTYAANTLRRLAPAA